MDAEATTTTDARPPLTDRQREVLDAIRGHIAEHGYPPTVRWLCSRLGMTSPNGIKCHLDSLIKKGYLRRGAGQARAITILD